MLKALFDDKKEAGIARELGISRHTVRTYMLRLHGKLRVNSRAALVTAILGQFLTAVVRRNSSLPPICARRAEGGCPFQQ